MDETGVKRETGHRQVAWKQITVRPGEVITGGRVDDSARTILTDIHRGRGCVGARVGALASTRGSKNPLTYVWRAGQRQPGLFSRADTILRPCFSFFSHDRRRF